MLSLRNRVRNLLVRTPVYLPMRRLLARHTYRRWTAADEQHRRFYQPFVSAGDLVFDIGANVGARTKIFAAMGARVVSVEPQAACVGMLEYFFADNRNVTIVPKAVGATPGMAEMLLASTTAISSLSAEWVEAARRTQRFPDHDWSRKQSVEITTLDGLIQTFGRPRFLKIDVEGYELEVLRGLSEAVEGVSFEFTPELLETAVGCVKRLESLGDYRFNITCADTDAFALSEWVEAAPICQHLEDHRRVSRDVGDVYARLGSAT